MAAAAHIFHSMSEALFKTRNAKSKAEVRAGFYFAPNRLKVRLRISSLPVLTSTTSP